MSMELLVASGIGMLTAVGVYLMFRRRTFPVVIGLTFLSYAVNVFLFAMGRLTSTVRRSSNPVSRNIPIRCRRLWCSRQS